MVGIHQRVFSPAQSINTTSTGHPRRDGSPQSGSPVSGSSSLAKVAIAQVYLLLGTIREDKDRSKWELQAEQLRKLVDENGMEVFQKYFIRLVVGNAPTIFPGINRPVANQSTYPMLVNEVRKISQDVSQAGKIAEAIETANEELFRDFDLSTFMDHFKLEPMEKIILALGFKLGSRSDLRTKADAILSNNFPHFLTYLSHDRTQNHTRLDSDFLATIIDRFIQYHPPNFTVDSHADLTEAVWAGHSGEHYPPINVLSALYLGELILSSERVAGGFLSQVRRLGSNFTVDEESCQRALRNMPNIRLDEEAVGTAILYTAISRSPRFSTKILVAALRRVVSRTFRWSSVIATFDKRNLRITRSQFLTIYYALLPLADDGREDSLDIQSLWSGPWANRNTQLSFIVAFVESSGELDISTIPRLQKSFSIDMYSNADDRILDRAMEALKHPLSSVSCIRAIFDAALESQETSESREAKRLFEVLTPYLDVFTISAVGAIPPESWHPFAEETLFRVFCSFLIDDHAMSTFALQSLWLLDETWVTDRFEKIHASHPLELPKILDQVVKQSWLEALIRRVPSGFTLDLTAMAHRSSYITTNELKALLDDLHELFPVALHFALNKFLSIKSEHEVEYREAQNLISHWLSAHTVFVFLEHLTSRLETSRSPEFMVVQRKCLGAYPRIVNYSDNDNLNAIIDANGQNGNALPREVVVAMEEHYKAMYANAAEVRSVLDALEGYRSSIIPMSQDIFACMISGLFDEYYAYSTYPLAALKTTALLFGGIVQRKLLPDLTQEIALGMTYDAVRDSPPESNLYKFGLQVLMMNIEHFDTWPGLCRQLVQIPTLEGTAVFGKAEQVVHENDIMEGLAMPNGGSSINDIDDVVPPKPPFRSIRAEPRTDHQDPPEDTQERVLFVLNNVTDENLQTKFDELKSVLELDYQAWFANHLVEFRAKSQLNYHQLYLSLVAQYDSLSLWAEVLRETYVSVARMLNAESTEKQPNERVLLKNLGAWLGSITLARGLPLKHKSIAFKQLLHEGHHTKRLSVVLPFVCKVLAEAKDSPIFHVENPWILDMLRCLSELYQTNLKLNLKFEIEVLFTHLGVRLDDIEPGSDLQTSFEHEDFLEHAADDIVDRFDAISLSGGVGGAVSGRFSPRDIIDRIPDLDGLLQFPPVNDMVDAQRFHEVVKQATHSAICDIIAPVVERSVTIAAISTKEMIKKDFATEVDETRVKSSAILMVKRTAGALALVTSKEPLRASMSNYIRQMSLTVGLALPEGLIILSVNANLDLACSIVEKRAEERAIPEIEDMIEAELINSRREHRVRANGHPFVDTNVFSRWQMTIAAPYKLSIGHGLNQDQMSIYDEFARVPRVPTNSQFVSDNSRPFPNDMLHDGFSGGSHLSQTLDPAALSHLVLQQPYTQASLNISNGRPASVDPDQLNARVVELLDNIVDAATNTTDDHLHSLAPLRQAHPVLDLIDTLLNWLVRSTQRGGVGDSILTYAIQQACERLFDTTKDSLAIEALLRCIQETIKLSPRLFNVFVMTISHQPDEGLLRVALAIPLLQNELVDIDRIDMIVSKKLLEHSDEALEFFSTLVNQLLFVEQPFLRRANFARSLNALHQWANEDASSEAVAHLVQDFSTHGQMISPAPEAFNNPASHMQQIEFVFSEWCALCTKPDLPQACFEAFIQQLHADQFTTRESTLMFLRFVVERCVQNHEQCFDNSVLSAVVAYQPIDALALFIVALVKQQCQHGDSVKNNSTSFLRMILAIITLILINHHATRRDNFNQKAFFRLFSTMLIRFKDCRTELGEDTYHKIMDEFAVVFHAVAPTKCGGFVFAWTSLISHRDFISNYVDRNIEDCGKIVRLLVDLLAYLCTMTKSMFPDGRCQELYGSTIKILIALNHDMPHVLAAYHTTLCKPLVLSSFTQIQNLILAASPMTVPSPHTVQLGLKLDRLEGIRNLPVIADVQSLEAPIRDAGLQDLIDQALLNGPSEDAIAHITRAIQHPKDISTTVGFSPVNVDVSLVNAVVLYIGTQSVEKAIAKAGPIYVSASPNAGLLTMLIHELSPEARYFFLTAMVNQLRYVNAHTHYFAQALLDIFGTENRDPEEVDIKEQILRIILERSILQWPQPWGLVIVAIELMKNDKYMLFDLPFVKNDGNVSEMLGGLFAQQ